MGWVYIQTIGHLMAVIILFGYLNLSSPIQEATQNLPPGHFNAKQLVDSVIVSLDLHSILC